MRTPFVNTPYGINTSIKALVLAMAAMSSPLYAQNSVAPQACEICRDDQGKAVQCDSRVRGQMLDNSSNFTVAPNGNMEFNAPTTGVDGPSNVWRRELDVMRNSASTLPQTQATQIENLSDADLGALFESGRDELLPASKQMLEKISAGLADKKHLRFLVVGHADTQRLSPRTRKIFHDNQGLSEARAFQVAQFLKGKLNLTAQDFTVRGEGDRVPLASNATLQGMAKNRRVEIQVWYDAETTLASKPETALQERALCGGELVGAPLPMRITVDGQPVDADGKVSEADRQRCVDVAVNRADIQIQYDPLKTDPALNISAWPDGVVQNQPVEFYPYSNYAFWVKKAEIRFFAPGQDPKEKPFLILPANIGETLRWAPGANMPAESYFVLRVYDAQGRFDETAMKALHVLARARAESDIDKPERERLTGYGDNSLRVRNIPVSGGSVTVSGKNIKADERVTALGYPVPVDPEGRFVLRQILPSGPHTVNVNVKNSAGVGTGFSRNLTLADNDWFYVALGDLTVAKNNTTHTSNAIEVTQDSDHFDHETEVAGRGAFYLKGKIKGEYLLTMSADTREQPIEDLFTNFASKDPRYLLERIDPDRYYPVYGDDSTTEWDAPTNGRMYVRLERGDSRAVWGNFQTQWTGLEFNQFSRSLYGGDVLLKSDAATSFGERRATLDVFGAEPGTLDSREEFRGTGGSLYYLRRQDITRGSERVWVELRDPVSGIALQRTQLIPGLDYDVNYLQGRILLRAPLPSTADGSTLVQAGNLSGNAVYLVSTYEYAPGLSEANSNVYGARASGWVNDYLRLGASGYRQGEETDRQNLGGIDATLRYKPGTYMDIEGARSHGPGTSFSSIDGGFGFNQSTTPDQRADAKRVQAAFDLSEVVDGARGRGGVYWQNRDAGFSGPGALAPTESIQQQGASFSVPLSEKTSVDVKADERETSTQGIEAGEAALHHQLNERWGVSVGGRRDDRRSDLPTASQLLSQNGARTDVILRFDYKPMLDKSVVAAGDAVNAKPVADAAGTQPATTLLSTNPIAPATLQPTSTPYDVTKSLVPAEAAAAVQARPADWQAYTFVQGTANKSGDRDENNRAGVGAEKQVTDRFRLGGEVSDGNLGTGGLLSGDYRVNDRSNVYVTHTVETERPDSNYRGRFDNTVVGSRMKLSDTVSVYDEARSARGAGPESLTNAFGVDLSPNDRWTYGVKFEKGTVSDPLAGDLDRDAIGLGLAYKYDKVKATSNLEYRDESGTRGDRNTWLMRNTAGYQATPDWRAIGKFNFSYSEASAGNFYDGDFIDASLGGAYRPISNDRWNTLIQYRYYYTLPSPGQVSTNYTTLDYAQRSHVISIDTIYDVRDWLSIGAKYGERLGELRNSRDGGQWYDSRADLVILRSELHFVREWDFLIEARRLTVYEADDQRAGFLTALYRHVGNHVKVGAGYNFTDFSDDLTDLSYKSRGPFINIMGTF